MLTFASFHKHPVTALTAGLLFGALLSTLSASASSFIDESSPEEIAEQFGLPLEDEMPFAENFEFDREMPWQRVVAPKDFKSFRLNLDIFRQSKKHPVLGEFREEYLDILVPVVDGVSPEARLSEARKRFDYLASREFALETIDGIPVKAYIVSGAIEQKVSVDAKGDDGKTLIDPVTGKRMKRMSMKTTPPGNYRLDVMTNAKKLTRADGTTFSQDVAYPWLTSAAYHDSQMYWGVWIKGGYFIHSTPHYGELGRPASMGCVRQSFPDAQDLFKLLYQDGLSGMIRIHPISAKTAVSRLRETIVDLPYVAPIDAPVTEAPLDPSKDMNWLLAQLSLSDQRIKDTIKFYGTELNIVGHEWMDPATGKPAAPTWPNCGMNGESPIDCFKTWGKKKPANSLN